LDSDSAAFLMGAFLVSLGVTYVGKLIWLKIFRKWNSRYPRLIVANVLSLLILLQIIVPLVQPDTAYKVSMVGVYGMAMALAQLIWLGVDCFKESKRGPNIAPITRLDL
jgi:hypothetical protein